VLPVSELARPAAANVAWHGAVLPSWCRRHRWDVVLATAANRRLPFGLSCPTVGVVHDLAAARVAGKYSGSRQLYVSRVVPRLVPRLTQVITVSEASRADILALCDVDPARVHVVPNGVDHAAFHPGDRDRARWALRALGFFKPFILYVARIEHPGKNHVTLIEAFGDLKRRTGLPHELVLVGADWNGATRVRADASRSPVADDIRFAGFVPGDMLPTFYQAADAVAFPSLYEGFGLPVLEAMASGVPVTCANTSSLPEVAGSAALLFEPTDAGQLSAHLERLLTDAVEAVARRAAGLARAQAYSWAGTAARTLDILKRASQDRSC